MNARSLALLISFAVGLLSLSQEIVWVRMVSFGHEGRPQAFTLVLVAFLLGIAAGAAAGKAICARFPDLRRPAGLLLLGAAAVDLAALYVAAPLLAPYALALPGLMLVIAACAALKGALFPIVHQMGSRQDERDPKLGRSISTVYTANVLGSALGPLLTGFWLLDTVNAETAMGLIAVSTALLGCWVLALAPATSLKARLIGVGLSMAALFSCLSPPAVMAELAAGSGDTSRLRHLIQNKHGVLHVLAEESPGQGDITFGGNVYDGRIQVDLGRNSNGLDRAYLVATLHARPARVLVIGLSSGAWLRAIQGMPGVESIDVVEINPAYRTLIQRYPEVSPVLSHANTRIHIDDGRRWLRRHPDARFDLIFMNTTFHWRSYASLLLSQEFFGQMKGHMAPGGVLAFNTTGSLDALQTAQSLFPHVIRYGNFAYASDQALVRDAQAEARLRASRIGDQPAFNDALFVNNRAGQKLLQTPLTPASEVLVNAKIKPEVISDLNLVPEFRHGRRPLYGAIDPWLPPSPHPD